MSILSHTTTSYHRVSGPRARRAETLVEYVARRGGRAYLRDRERRDLAAAGLAGALLDVTLDDLHTRGLADVSCAGDHVLIELREGRS